MLLLYLEERSSRESVKTLLDLLVERKAEAALKSSSRSETLKRKFFNVIGWVLNVNVEFEFSLGQVVIKIWQRWCGRGMRIRKIMGVGLVTSEEWWSKRSWRKSSWKPVWHSCWYGEDACNQNVYLWPVIYSGDRTSHTFSSFKKFQLFFSIYTLQHKLSW